MRWLLALCVLLLSALPAGSGNSVFYGTTYLGAGIQVLYPSADSATSNWTVPSGTHFSNIDEAVDAIGLPTNTHDSDTTYIACPALTCADTYDLTNSSGLTGKKILYVTSNSVARKSLGGTSVTTTFAIRTGATNYTTQTFNTSSTTYIASTSSTKYYTNPNTGLAWTTADLDGLQLVVSATIVAGKEMRVTCAAVIVAYEDSDTITIKRERSGGGD